MLRKDRSMTTIHVPGTTLHTKERGNGPPLLLIHGAGEDAAMLGPQAKRLAAAGYRTITYDRRGTGRSGRDDWPGRGADQHADDAAALLDALDAAPAVVLGVSSGGVVALALAARHPDLVERVVAWEPPAVGVLPDGVSINCEIMAPALAHLAANAGDFVGAQAVLLTAILGFPVAVDDPAFAAARANAEPMILDDPTITLRPFGPGGFPGGRRHHRHRRRRARRHRRRRRVPGRARRAPAGRRRGRPRGLSQRPGRARRRHRPARDGGCVYGRG